MDAAVLLAAFASQGARADVLAKEDLVKPNAPPAQDRIRIVGLKVDPSKPVWVSYSLFALSAETDRKGEVVVEGSPEGVAVPIADARIRFSAERMSVLRGSEKVGEPAEEGGSRAVARRDDCNHGPAALQGVRGADEERGAGLRTDDREELPRVG